MQRRSRKLCQAVDVGDYNTASTAPSPRDRDTCCVRGNEISEGKLHGSGHEQQADKILFSARGCSSNDEQSPTHALTETIDNP